MIEFVKTVPLCETFRSFTRGSTFIPWSYIHQCRIHFSSFSWYCQTTMCPMLYQWYSIYPRQLSWAIAPRRFSTLWWEKYK